MAERYVGRVVVGTAGVQAVEIDDLDTPHWVGWLPDASDLPTDQPVGVTLVAYTVRLLDGHRTGQAARAGNSIRDHRMILQGSTPFLPEDSA